MVQILNIPENETELALWLESLLVSRDFGELVSQLAFLGQGVSPAESTEMPEQTKEAIIESGLSKVGPGQCRLLLRDPKLLIELNERIFETGSQYWMSKLEPATADEDQFFNRTVSILGGQPPSNSQDDVAAVSRATDSVSEPSGFSRRQLLAMAASILAVVCGVYFFQSSGAASDTPWGWQSAQAMPEGVSADRYLRSLSDSAEEWFAQKSTTAEMLAANLQSLSTGCQRLIDAPHRPLSPEQRHWLVEKCELWKKDIDQFLADAKAIGGDVSKLKVVKNAADDLISKIALSLTNKSKEV